MIRREEILDKMIKVYRPKSIDWMGCAISPNNPLIYHYISKRNDHKVTFENGALLTKSSHGKLLMLMDIDHELFEEWQWLFSAINSSYCYPSRAHIEMMYELKKQTDEALDKKYKDQKLILK